MSILRRKKKTKEKGELPIEADVPMVAVPPESKPLKEVQSIAKPTLTKEQWRASLERFLMIDEMNWCSALAMVDETLWAMVFQYVTRNEEAWTKGREEEIMNRASGIMADIMPFLEKYVTPDDANALLVVSLYLVGLVTMAVKDDPVFQALVGCGQEWKGTMGQRPVGPFSRKDLGYG